MQGKVWENSGDWAGELALGCVSLDLRKLCDAASAVLPITQFHCERANDETNRRFRLLFIFVSDFA